MLVNRDTFAQFESEECTALAEDPQGGLWIGTTAGLIHLAGAAAQRFTTEDGLDR